MPILKKEIDLYPADLLEAKADSDWFMVYTRSRREKDLMRHLIASEVGCCAPCVEKSYRSPNGRKRTSWVPLFSNYVFIAGTPEDCSTARKSNCVSSIGSVGNPTGLVADLRCLYRLLDKGVSLNVESQITAGDTVRIRSGAFAGCEGVVTKRHGKNLLVVAVHCIGQAVTVAIEDFTVEAT